MRSLIRQTVHLPATAEKLYDMYLSPMVHALVTGSPVKIGPEPGSVFEAFDGVLTGHIIDAVAPCLIVQSWRSEKFHAEDPDSTLVLHFTNEGTQGRIDLIHVDVPEHDRQGVIEGWEKYYWTPWRDYLQMSA